MSFGEELMGEFDDTIKEHRDEVVRLAFEGWTKLTTRSRVDTGRFRASWTINEGSPDTSVKDEGVHPAPVRPRLGRVRDFPVIFVSNSLPYAEPLEALDGIVALTVAEQEAFNP